MKTATLSGVASILVIVSFVFLMMIFASVLMVSNAAGFSSQLALAETDLEGFGLPVRIRITSLSLNAEIETVGLTSGGSMGVPFDPMNVGWYKFGPRPGEVGSAVMDGHVDWYNGQTAVFADLELLQPGDKIEVQDEEGAINTFIVSEIKKYVAGADATEVFVSSDGQAHLNLITCAGVWSRLAGQYTERLVVFSTLESSN